MKKDEEPLPLKEKLQIVLIFAILFGAVYALYYAGQAHIKKGIFTIGEIVSFSNNGGAAGKSADVLFYSNREKVVCYTSNINGYTIGDKFKVEYDSSDPTECIVHTESPVFIDSEWIDSSVGIITQVNDTRVRFSYEGSNGASYKRFQRYDNKKYHPQKGQRYLVECWQDDHQRSIIYFDEPR